MEALIHHFKLVTEGFRVPPGEVYYPIESPRGELGCFVRSDGSSKPARVHMRDPSFVNLQALAPMARGSYIADLIATLGDARPDPRRDRPMSAVRRYEHGSRVPGWDEAADLTQGPGGDPRPRDDAVPAGAARGDRGAHGTYPDRRSATLPALAAAQRVHGWCSPEAIDQVACVMRLTPAYLASVATFYDMLETTPVGRHCVYVCTNISCSLCGADELYEAVRAAGGRGSVSSTCAPSSASGPATSRRWPPSTASTSAR